MSDLVSERKIGPFSALQVHIEVFFWLTFHKASWLPKATRELGSGVCTGSGVVSELSGLFGTISVSLQ